MPRQNDVAMAVERELWRDRELTRSARTCNVRATAPTANAVAAVGAIDEASARYCTVTVPDMLPPWMVQWYGNRPRVGNVTGFTPDAKFGMPLGALVVSNVTLCVTPVVFIQLTVPPGAMVMSAGLKVLDVVMQTVPFPGVHTVGGGVGVPTEYVASLPPHEATSAAAMATLAAYATRRCNRMPRRFDIERIPAVIAFQP